MSLCLILSPNLKTSSMKVSNLLKEMSSGFETLFLNIPREMEEIVLELADGRITYDELVDEACRLHLIPEPIGSWEYAMKPILEVLHQLSREYQFLRTFCYGSSVHEFASMNVAVRIANLILRTILKEEVEVDEWRATLNRSLDVDMEAMKAEVEAIIERIEGLSACVSDMGGICYKRPLRKAGLDVKIRYVEKPYHFTPLMILKRRMARGFVSDEEVERLVKCQVEYVRSFIYRFDNRDRAYYEWVYDKVPFLRRKINKEEVEILNSIIQ